MGATQTEGLLQTWMETCLEITSQQSVYSSEEMPISKEHHCSNQLQGCWSYVTCNAVLSSIKFIVAKYVHKRTAWTLLHGRLHQKLWKLSEVSVLCLGLNACTRQVCDIHESFIEFIAESFYRNLEGSNPSFQIGLCTERPFVDDTTESAPSPKNQMHHEI